MGIAGPDARDCESDGHVWQFVGRAKDGTEFYKCRKCGKECER